MMLRLQRLFRPIPILQYHLHHLPTPPPPMLRERASLRREAALFNFDGNFFGGFRKAWDNGQAGSNPGVESTEHQMIDTRTTNAVFLEESISAMTSTVLAASIAEPTPTTYPCVHRMKKNGEGDGDKGPGVMSSH